MEKYLKKLNNLRNRCVVGRGMIWPRDPFEHFTLDVENKDALQNQIADNENDHILLKDHDFLVKMSNAQNRNEHLW